MNKLFLDRRRMTNEMFHQGSNNGEVIFESQQIGNIQRDQNFMRLTRHPQINQESESEVRRQG